MDVYNLYVLIIDGKEYDGKVEVADVATPLTYERYYVNWKGGIDGIIKQDELGLDMIYVQAKRWDKDSTVSRPEIQKFAGALLGEGATKGVFITTANFSKTALDYAKSVPNSRIILIDGLTLAKFMIKHDLGVSTSNTIRIKKIDSDYFEEQ